MWSYSKLNQYEKCPYALVLKKLHKQAPNEHMERGSRIHTALENFIKDEGNIPPEADHFTLSLNHLKRQKAQPEYKLFVNKDWQPCAEADAWGMGILDLLYTHEHIISVIDYKTGKVNATAHADQKQTYALLTAAHYPDRPINVDFWYVDQKKSIPTLFTPDVIPKYQEVLTRRLTIMENDTALNPKPSKWNCKLCNYREHCEYRDNG